MNRSLYRLFIIIILMLTLSCKENFCYTAPKAYPNKRIEGNVQSIQIPRGTLLKIKFLDPIDTDLIVCGDWFAASIIEDERFEGKLVIPSGTMIRGIIKDIKPRKLPSRSAILSIAFDHMVAPSGRQLPLSAAIVNAKNLTLEGDLDGGGNYISELKRNAEKSKELLVKSYNVGIDSGDNIFDGVGKIITVPICTIGGSFVSAGYLISDSIIDLFRKGRAVQLQQDDTIEIMLTKPVNIPIY